MEVWARRNKPPCKNLGGGTASSRLEGGKELRARGREGGAGGKTRTGSEEGWQAP